MHRFFSHGVPEKDLDRKVTLLLSYNKKHVNYNLSVRKGDKEIKGIVEINTLLY